MPPPPTTPILKDLTISNITENVHLINAQTPSPRLLYILERLVTHLHDFARETRLSTPEWMAGIEFLTAVGQKCTDVRQEFILLSDTLGLSLLVDAISHPKPPASTEGTVLGPYHTHAAPDVELGESITVDPEGERLLCVCSVRDTAGRPVEGVKVDVWETDSKGVYDVQYEGWTGEKADGRAVLRTDAEGRFWYRAIVPVPYRIPEDGPVGKMLKLLGRHPWRPSHMHFMFEKPGYDHLITALYLRGDPYETTDAVFGVKESLIVDLGVVSAEQAAQYGVEEGTKLLTYDFVLVSEAETRRLRDEEARKAMKALGRDDMLIIDGLPVPDVD
ncbi:cathecol 1,2-dioxygenase [Aaosphaeria arxii CBS 175.79]|uniref:Cathecol 1,2-dioxygenase n=1 Tax=Aaosphaeria arxii CBS 175.79 TaxID=1450172 RepID=A0A6A5XVP2_9PLEO|nr:cathecol 1,2-dioxygenase [Aaosphaeria arxii CBS 175.79]KAF2016324.1 cathecol 1,2-dioxygenase [Aaosphaeria arxii CBS 175.79]